MDKQEIESRVEDFNSTFAELKGEISRFIVGQDKILEQVLVAIFCQGHVLLEGVPGLGKTALVQSIAKVMDLQFRRIQFTPDLLPADIMGTNVFIEKDGKQDFEFHEGPVFTQILLADEINRATPKTQSALLETMQEKTVTVGNRSNKLPAPFFVFATQNPVEMDGTYALPEAQLDRFFFKLMVELPEHDEFKAILDRTMGLSSPELEKRADGPKVLEMCETAKSIPIEDSVQDYLIEVVRSTHPGKGRGPKSVEDFIRHGASPRAAQSILAAARVNAILQGRYHVAKEDIRDVAVPALRHRMILSFEGEAEGMSSDRIIAEIFDALG